MRRKSITGIRQKDRLSEMTDAIILHILSFMDAKAAIRTEILSKRFACLWTEAPCLDFWLATVDIVYSTIFSHKRLNLEKVSVIICRNRKDDPEEKRKFLSIIEMLASVKEFILDFTGVYYTLPQHFYSNASLKKLTLTDCHIKTNGFVNWKSLQSLSLEFIKLSDDKLSEILSGCPSLNFLQLSRIQRCSRIDLTNSKCLRKLVIDYFSEADSLEIVAPNLQSLVLTGVMRWLKCKVLHANSLTDCFLDFCVVNAALNKDNVMITLKSLLDDLWHAEVVTIGEWVLQVLSSIRLYELPCPMSKSIKFLKIRTTFTKDDMAGIVCLLRNLIRLEILSIELDNHAKKYFLPWLSGKVG